jgi:hypothetical protein
MENRTNDNHLENMPPINKEELLNRIHKEWTQLLQVILPLDEDQMTTAVDGGWTIKDNLAHIIAWEQYLIHHHIRKSPPHDIFGMDSETYKKSDEDDINAFLFQKNKDLTLNQVRTDLRSTHEALLSELERLPFSTLIKPRYDDDQEGRPLLWWIIANTYDHYIEHRTAIERLIQDQK